MDRKLNRRHFAFATASAPMLAAAGRALAQTPAGPSQAAPPTAGVNSIRQITARLAG